MDPRPSDHTPARNAEPVETGLKRPVRLIVIHCSATPNARTLFYGVGTKNLRTPVDEIDDWHWAPPHEFRRGQAARNRFNPTLRSIGYHYVIARNGGLFTGRHPDEVGAHAQGHNSHSIGVCLIGKNRYTPQQWATLADCLPRWCAAHGVERRFATPARREGVCGHRDLSPDKNSDGAITKNEFVKECPGFSVADWLRGGMEPLEGHIAAETR
jgi:N-acetylmuramoyl-L-alanine amidase